MLDLMGSAPVSVSCSGLAYLNESIHDVCTLNMQFENNRMGIVHVSWLDPTQEAGDDGRRQQENGDLQRPLNRLKR